MSPTRLWVSFAVLSAAVALAAVWLLWRVATMPLHPLPVVVFLIELSGWTGGLLVALGLLGGSSPGDLRGPDDTYRYASAVAACVGRPQAVDLQRDLRAATERLTSRTASSTADRAMIGVLLEGPRRIALVAMLSLGLLLGVAPAPLPPAWAIVAVAAATILIALSHVLASGGRVHFGDRTRWSFASLGEVISPSDRADVAPRRWVGTVGVIVVLNLSIALRGMSDRWTHGLPAMTDDERLVAMSWASTIVLGGLYVLRTIPTPKLGNANVVARRLEERTAR